MKKKTALVIREEHYELASVPQMTKMAAILKDHIIKNKLYTNIAGKNYAHVDGWAFAGGLMGVLPRVVSVENLSQGTEKKWRANVELIRMKDDKVIGFGIALCSNAETKKRTFDEYAVLSMAQTRAIGKAYRNSIGWVMKLAGYEATPNEEMHKVGEVKEGEIRIDVGETDEVGLYGEEVEQIQKVLASMGHKGTKQLEAVKRFAEKEGFKFDGWRMTKNNARALLAALLQRKLQK